LILNTVSTHFQHNSQENNINLGAFYRFGIEDQYVIGAYDNSHRKLSIFAGERFHLTNVDKIDVGVIAGAVTGYARPILPGALLSLRYKVNERVSIYLHVAPVDSGVASLAIGWNR